MQVPGGNGKRTGLRRATAGRTALERSRAADMTLYDVSMNENERC